MSNEETLNKYLEAWRSQNWAVMAELTQLTWHSKHPAATAWLQDYYGHLSLSRWKIKTVDVLSDCAVRFTINVVCNGRKRQIQANVICETGPYQPALNGRWGVNPVSLLG